MRVKEKTCFKCHVTKPITEFYVHPAMGDQRLNKCKECTRKDVQANYRANIERYKEYERRRANLPHRVAARNAYARSEAGRIAGNRAKRHYLDRNPIKHAAHIAVGNAIRNGRLLREPCEVCGAKAQAHHDDYGRPLDVRWLCAAHHAEWHRHNTPICPDAQDTPRHSQRIAG